MSVSDLAKAKSLSNSQWISIIGAVALTVWTVSGIYFRFEQVEEKRKADRARIEYVDERVTRINTSLEGRIKELENHHKK